MLTKEKCMDALNKMINTSYSRWYRSHGKNAKPYFLDGFHKNPIYKGDYKSLKVIKKLIKEHFELVEHAKKLQDEVDKYKHEYFSMCDLVENTKAYKLEDLKPGMWVWDDKWEECFEICKIFPKDNEVYVLIHQNRINVKRNEPIKFEEGRFFPVTKALEY